MAKRICLACDLKDEPHLIQEYLEYHKSENVWPEIKQSIYDAGIQSMEIYRTGHRLIMIMEVDDSFSMKRKADLDTANPKVQEWESLMWNYQQSLPWAPDGVKWLPLDKIFELD